MAIRLSWFKLLWLNSDERKALKEASKQQEDFLEEKPQDRKEYFVEEVSKLPYKNILYSNKNITVIFWSGAVISRMGVERDIFQKVKDAKTEAEIEDLLIDKPIGIETNGTETVEDKKQITDNLYVFRNNKDFEVINEEVFLKPAKLALPAVVAATFIEILEKKEANKVTQNISVAEELHDSYKTLKMFWLKLALNALPLSREDTLVFVKKNDVRLTKNGNMVLYRRIVTQGTENKELVKFISQEYFKAKKWKKSPYNYEIFEDLDTHEYFTNSSSKKINKEQHKQYLLVGNLSDLYKNLENMVENTYTSYHNQGEHTIKIGGLYKIDDNQINLDNGLCAAGGIHAACVDYNYSSFGDTPVVVLVNPSKAITVPRDETGKLRTTEMFIACINDKVHGEHFDGDSLDVFDEEYHDLTIQELEEAVKDKDYSVLRVKDQKPSVTPQEVVDIVGALKNRVKQLV